MSAPPQTTDPIDALLADYFQRLDQGEAVSPTSLIAANPDLEVQLREFFDAASFVEQLAGPTHGEQSQMQSAHDTARSVLLGETIVSTLASGERQLPDRFAGAHGQSHREADAPRSPLEHFGRYEIQRLLGQGAMGSVYLAYDPSLQRQVALKIPKFSDESNPDMRDRFLREARSAATLRHANICPVYDVGRVDGVHYITMAYIEGRTLAEELRAGRTFTPREIATIARKLALALGKAHSAGVIHRDLKPGNIMLDAEGEPVLMDFGLAYREENDELRLTKTGTIVGSPAYMSPEQIDGDPAKIGSASDIYSLGVVLYEMITGKLPFQGTMMSVIGQIATKEPTPVGQWRKELADSPLERLCRKMLAKQIGDRPQTMQEVARALDYILSGLPGDAVGTALGGAASDGETERRRDGETSHAGTVSPSVAPSLLPAVSPSASFAPPTAQVVKYPEAVLAQERRDRAKMFLATTLILLVLGGFLAAAAGIVYVATNQGTLEVTSHVDNIQIEVIGENGHVRVLDLDTGTKVVRLPTGDYSIVLSGNRNNVVIDRGQVTMKRGTKVAVTARLMNNPPRVADAARANITLPSDPSGLRPNEAARRAPPRNLLGRVGDHHSDVRGVAFAPDDRRFVTVGWDGVINLHDTQTRLLVRSWKGHKQGIYRARFLPDGRLLTSAYDGSVKLWDVAKPQELKSFAGHEGPVTAIDVSRDGKLAVTSGFDRTVRFWNLETLEAIGTPQKIEQGEWIWDAALAPDGKSAATAGFDGKIRLWNAETGASAGEIAAHQGAALSVAYVGQGQLLSGGRDGAIRLWDAVTKTKVFEFGGFDGYWIESLSVNRDGTRALAALANPDKAPNPSSRAGNCAVIDLVARQVAVELSTGAPYIYATAFSSDSSLALTGGGPSGQPGAAHLWNLESALRPAAPARSAARKLQPVLWKRFRGHEEYVMAVALARSGKLLASGSADQAVMLWNTESGERLALLKLHDDDVRAIAFTSDTSRFLTASNDRKIRIWDTDLHVLKGTLAGHKGPVSSLVMLPDDQRAISGSDDKTLILWNLAEGKQIYVAEFHAGPVSCLAISPDGQTAASAGKDNVVILSEIQGDKLVRKHRLAGHTGEIRGLAFSPDGQFVVSCARDTRVKIWNAREGKPYKTIPAAVGTAYSVAISPSGKWLAVGGGDWTKGAIKIYSFPSGQTAAEIRDFQGFVHALDFTDDSTTLAAGSADKTVSLWWLEGGPASGSEADKAITEVLQIPGHGAHVTSLALANDGETVVSGSADGTVLARDVEPRFTRRAMSGHRRERPVVVASSRDGSLVVSGDFDGKLRINRSGAGGVKEFDAHPGGVLHVALSPDETKVLTTGCDNTAKLWNAATGELVQTLDGHSGWVTDGVFLPSGERIVTASFDAQLKLWSAATGELLKSLSQPELPHCLAVSPDGRHIAAGLRDGSVRLYDPEHLVENARLVGHTDRVRDLVFTPDSQHIVSGSYDRTMRMWSVETAKQVAMVQHEKHIFNTLAIAPDGQHVFSAGGIWKPDEDTNDWVAENDYVIRMWRIAVEE